MKEKIEEIKARFQKAENREKYTEFILHAGKVNDADKIRKCFDDAHNIAYKQEKTENEERQIDIGTEHDFWRKVQQIEKWLDENDWAK